jgi:hypothetical protein
VFPSIFPAAGHVGRERAQKAALEERALAEAKAAAKE